MNDTELADALVEHGIGSKHVDCDLYDWSSEWANVYQTDHMCRTRAGQFVRDWRVAGACLEKMTSFHLQFLAELLNTGDIRCPRAICMAFVEATK